MPPRVPVPGDESELPTVLGALRRRAPRLLLASILVGTLVFVLLTLFAPKYLGAATKSALAALASFAAGSAWTAMKARRVVAYHRTAHAMREPPGLEDLIHEEIPAVPPPLPEPLVREMTEEEAGASATYAAPVQPFTAEGEIASIAERIEAHRPAAGGHRTLLTGETDRIDASAEAVELAKAFAADGSHVIIVDWSPSGRGFASQMGLKTTNGINDLFRGGTSFDRIIQRLPRTRVHAIASGAHLDDESAVEADQLNLVLDALDEAYDYIIVTGYHDEARGLFETIEGRFDTGVVVAEPFRAAHYKVDAPGTFLGFEVAEIDIIRFIRRDADTAVADQRMARRMQMATARLAKSA